MANIETGSTRRDLLKKGAVAGGLIWAAPVIQSGTAWAQTAQDNCACTNGFIIYTKYSGRSTNSGATPSMNQCLDPVPGAIGVPISCLISNGLVHVGDVATSDRQATVSFTSGVFLMKTAFKATNDCYYSFCSDGFETQRHAVGTGQPPHEPGTAIVTTPPLFSFTSDADTACGNDGVAPAGSSSNPDCVRVKRVIYDSTALSETGGGDDPLNYIEILLCLPGTSKPPTC